MKKCVIIYNKKSGKVKPTELINHFYNIIEDYGYELEVITTKKRGHAATIMEELPNDVDLVIAAGGDGTFNEAIRGNIKRKKKLLMAHLPLGTTNDVGTMYGFSKDYKIDLELILTGVKKNIDIIMLNGNPFVYVAAFGNFINVTFDTPKKWKERFGRMAYVLFGFTEIKERIHMHHIKYTVDGVEKEGKYSYIFITNSNRIGGVDNIYPDIKLDDNKFEVLLCTIHNKAEIIRSLYLMKNKGIENVPGCEYYCTSNFKIEFDNVPEFSWGLDGEEFKVDTNIFDFTINKDINILLPEYNIDRLFIEK
ncbi:MAG: YegS/Rv2252/BmrU family lipid kinase [Bacilli bacterium]|nr:YegS/Rv2252/BmrU family lipid kinase [Bacilli bacterium]